MEGRYSTRSPAVKRLMREAQELCEPTDQYFAQPLEDNLFEWHFTIRGPLDSDFQAGLYHGRIILPVDYPMKPPSIIWLTPNGRFETNKKICLSISGHHPESWQPSWSIRTALLAIIGFMPTHPGGAIGSLDYKPEERKALAKKSRDWKCPICGDVSEILLEPSPESNQTSQEAKELASQISFQGEKPKTAETKSNDEMTALSPPPGNTTTTTPSTEAASATASPTTTTSTPPETPSTSAGQTPASGIVYPPWACPPVLPTSYSMIPPPPFMQYPWTCLSMPQGGQLGSIVSQIPRFPYPPSYYANNAGAFYPTGFPLPPGMGMFPCPFPPPPTTFGHSLPGHNINPPVSVNNSSLSPPNRSPDRGSHSLSPDAPRIPNIPPPSPASVVSSQAGSSAPVSPQCSPLKEHVLNELLSKVKRVGSEVHVSSNAVMDSDMKREAAVNSQIHIESYSTVVKEIPESCIPCKQAAELVSAETNNSEVIPDVKLEDAEQVQEVMESPDHATNLEPLTSQIVNISTISEALKCAFDVTDESAEVNSRPLCDGLENQQDGGDQCPVEDKSQVTDTDISVSLMKKESINESTGMEISHSELSADPGDDEELGNLALEVSDTEQRSHFERNTSSSMPDLKKKLKLGTVKGLRQRQSALAQVPCDTAGEEQTLSDQASSGSGRQRIEAVAGDSFANQQRFHHNAANAENEAAQNRANLAYQAARRAQEGQANSNFDVCFVAMIGLCVTTVFILLNRLFYMVDFSAVFY